MKNTMTQLESVKREIQTLSPSELAAFRRWFHEFDAAAWDRQLEQDVDAGKLDQLAARALQSLESEECAEL